MDIGAGRGYPWRTCGTFDASDRFTACTSDFLELGSAIHLIRNSGAAGTWDTQWLARLLLCAALLIAPALPAWASEREAAVALARSGHLPEAILALQALWTPGNADKLVPMDLAGLL